MIMRLEMLNMTIYIVWTTWVAIVYYEVWLFLSQNILYCCIQCHRHAIKRAAKTKTSMELYYYFGVYFSIVAKATFFVPKGSSFKCSDFYMWFCGLFWQFWDWLEHMYRSSEDSKNTTASSTLLLSRQRRSLTRESEGSYNQEQKRPSPLSVMPCH